MTRCADCGYPLDDPNGASCLCQGAPWGELDVDPEDLTFGFHVEEPDEDYDEDDVNFGYHS